MGQVCRGYLRIFGWFSGFIFSLGGASVLGFIRRGAVLAWYRDRLVYIFLSIRALVSVEISCGK